MDMAQRVTAAEVSSEQIKRFDWFSAFGAFGTRAVIIQDPDEIALRHAIVSPFELKDLKSFL